MRLKLGRPFLTEFTKRFDVPPADAGTPLMVTWLGVATLLRHRRRSTSERPSWIEGLGALGPLPAFGIGLALNVRPKSLLLLPAFCALAPTRVARRFRDALDRALTTCG